eukprot:6518786-Prymnesium_polylepis.1
MLRLLLGEAQAGRAAHPLLALATALPRQRRDHLEPAATVRIDVGFHELKVRVARKPGGRQFAEPLKCAQEMRVGSREVVRRVDGVHIVRERDARRQKPHGTEAAPRPPVRCAAAAAAAAESTDRLQGKPRVLRCGEALRVEERKVGDGHRGCAARRAARRRRPAVHIAERLRQ